MKIKKLVGVAVAGALTVTLLAGCDNVTEYQQRKQLQKGTTLSNSLEKANLEKKLQRENDPNAIRYIYLLSFGKPFGYYTVKGKVSSSGSQLAPEEEVIKGYGGDGYVLDSAQDDGTYGNGDPGVFFFTTDGVMVETSLDYIIEDQPLALNVPELHK